ncbi:MAG: cysteine synthase [Acidimicrobiaceae bacterium]|jgi:cysteine synthase A|nr:cysteine synthase [Acidimicrobiaceae bacterium]MDQ1445630.1 cysteine synthase [Acidimicrobiaceae bacterium]
MKMDVMSSGVGLDGDMVARMILRTPCLPIPQPNGTTVWAKLEFLQPSGSTKDRFAAVVLSQAIESGAVRPGTTVIEASSGSTSIAFAMACARLSLPFVAVVPDSVSDERAMIIRRYGGELVLTPAAQGVATAIATAERLAAEVGDAFLPQQFCNPLNALAHETGTGRELLDQVDGVVHAFVAGVGTGGTLAGVGRALHAANPDVVLAEARPMGGDGACPPLGIPGIVACMSGLLDETDVAWVIPVTEDDALDAARELCRMGLPVGLSSGLNMAASRALAADLPKGSRVATVFPDRMERYFTGTLFADLVMA